MTRKMSRDGARPLTWLALGVVIALAGPLGLAVGFFSHPVGLYSHPGSVAGYAYGRGQIAASGYWYGYGDSGWTSLWIDVRKAADASAAAAVRGTRAAQSSDEGYVDSFRAGYVSCDRDWDCHYGRLEGTSSDSEQFDFEVDPLLRRARFSGVIDGHTVHVAWSGVGDLQEGGWDYHRMRPEAPQVNGSADYWLWRNASATVSSGFLSRFAEGDSEYASLSYDANVIAGGGRG